MIYYRKSNQIYDAWIHWEVTTKCNLFCTYCFFGESEESEKEKQGLKEVFHKTKELLLGSKAPQRKDPRIYGKLDAIDLPKLLKYLDKTKKTFRISFTGGEPFLIPNIIEVCKALSKKHYLSFNTNLISPNADIFPDEIPSDRVLFIVASLHLRELERLKLQRRYVKIFHHFQNLKFPIFARVVAYPNLAPDVDTLLSYYRSNNVDVGFEPFLGLYKGKKYPEAYTDKELSIFSIDRGDFSMYSNWKNQPCIAGHVAVRANSTGNVSRCFMLDTPYGSVYDGIKFSPKAELCPLEYCGCPFNKYDPYLAERYLNKCESHLRGVD